MARNKAFQVIEFATDQGRRGRLESDARMMAEKLDTIVIAAMTAEEKTAMLLEVEKMQSVAYQKIKLLKA